MWSPGERLLAGTGGTQNYTAGHVRELNRRGIAAQVVTVGVGDADGRDGFTDVPFRSLPTAAAVGRLDGVVVFTTAFPAVAMARPAYQVLHVPPPVRAGDRRQMAAQTADRRLIVTSRFAARLWADFLDVDAATFAVVYPYAESCFGSVERPVADSGEVRVLYAGRLTPEKGIYTLLEMIHADLVADLLAHDARVTFTVTTAGSDKPHGRMLRRMLSHHPGVRLVPASTTSASMAATMADHDVVLMPSNSQYWHETFGIVSIEAQHAGSRVVASDDGGLPETDCGAISLVTPDDAVALARGIGEAVARGPVPAAQRRAAARLFTVGRSVDALLDVLTGAGVTAVPVARPDRPGLTRVGALPRRRPTTSTLTT